ncbi:hypothetical protein [Enterocloster lavalensis]|uniref:hypothetical protein n=1 Tax=Enterocloster lavalensis TaxID=460384 RepID=UPI000D198FCC|nr:hypothetical protein [Enterocloster lavalensis]PST33965.1 hypothetical protein C7256_05995 [Enterocloster lavalensis]
MVTEEQIREAMKTLKQYELEKAQRELMELEKEKESKTEPEEQLPQVPRMRTIRECVEYFKANDPESKITRWRIESWLTDGVLPYMRSGKSGNTKLINLDLLIKIVNNPVTTNGGRKEVTPIKMNNRRTRKII